MAQLMTLPLTVSCSSKSRLDLPFWYQLTRVILDKGLLNECCFVVVNVGLEYDIDDSSNCDLPVFVPQCSWHAMYCSVGDSISI